MWTSSIDWEGKKPPKMKNSRNNKRTKNSKDNNKSHR